MIRTAEELRNLLLGAAEREPSQFDQSVASVRPTGTAAALCYPLHLAPLGFEHCVNEQGTVS